VPELPKTLPEKGEVPVSVTYNPPRTVIVTLTLPVRGAAAESVAVTVKLYVPDVFASGVPAIIKTAPDGDNVSPAGSTPEVTAKL
jgi:hypothetical protein